MKRLPIRCVIGLPICAIALLLHNAPAFAGGDPFGQSPNQGSVPRGTPSTSAPPPHVAPTHPVYQRYGHEIVLADLAAMALMVSGTPLGFAAPFVAAPTVHFMHGNRAAGMKSASLRVGLTFAGFLAGGAIAGDCGTDDCDIEQLLGVGLGGLSGFALAAFIDWTLLAKLPVAPPPSVTIAPSVSITPGEAVSVGLLGRF